MSELVNLSDTTLIKAGNAFCVALRDGRLPLEGDHPLGVYVNDCRFVRGYELRVGGQQPRLLISTDTAGTAAVYEFTNPELTNGEQELPLQSLRIRAERRMLPEAMVERVSVRSHARGPVKVEVELRLDADYSPMLEVRGIAPRRRREVRRERRRGELRFAAIGLDGVERSTIVTCAVAETLGDGRLRARLVLQPGDEALLDIRFDFVHGREGVATATVARAATEGLFVSHAGADAEAWLAGRCRVTVDDDLIERVMRRSLLDLRLLASELDGHRYYAAGVPWYATLFGRDSIIAALQTLAFDADIAADTLRLLAARLGSRIDDEHDEEPGKVLHELRQDELAAAGLTPFARYYGTVDATPLFLCLLCEHADWTGSLKLFDELLPQVEAALTWIEQFGDLDGDRLLEYHRRSPHGLDNHCWKDSWDGVPDEYGSPLAPPVAVVEAQGYAVAARRGVARLYERSGDRGRADALRDDAARLRAEIDRFWLPERGFYAIGLDGEKRPSRALGSNQGHLLWAQAVPSDRAGAICRSLMGSASHSGWGVRTLSSEEPAFNPVGYHTGSVWPHDNAMFAAGLRKYGLDEPFLRVMEGLLDVASVLPDYRLPELFAGFSRADYEDPVPYPVACSPQAWAAGALPCLLIAALGIVPDALDRTLRIRRPSLPRHLDRATVEGLHVGDARVDLLFERVGRGDSVALTDAKVEGRLDVVLEIRQESGLELGASAHASLEPTERGLVI
ncbi:MAG TPA: glycogen debranching N-terminal domain-containing protein [Solirubrobacteraceae bacterium]